MSGATPLMGEPFASGFRKEAFPRGGGGATVVMLLPARTDTGWFHDFVYNKAEIRFVRGRLKFGGSKNSAPFPSMVVIFRGDVN